MHSVTPAFLNKCMCQSNTIFTSLYLNAIYNTTGTSKQKRDASVQNTAGGRKRQRRGGDSDDDSQRTRQTTRATKGKRRKTGEDSEDDSQPNTYDYTDSFIDDEGASNIVLKVL